MMLKKLLTISIEIRNNRQHKYNLRPLTMHRKLSVYKSKSCSVRYYIIINIIVFYTTVKPLELKAEKNKN